CAHESLDVIEIHIRNSSVSNANTDDLSTDLVGALWSGKYSSLFGTRAMTTAERYFIAVKASLKEEKNP
ncbi:fructose-bisphosphatase class III, partial [Staphylococcus aureus]